MEADRTLGVLDFEHEGINRLFDDVSNPDADRPEVLLAITRRLAAHIAVEQSLFLPVVRDRGLGGPDMPDGLETEYHDMQRLLVLIERRKVNSPDMPQLVTDLKDVFGAHIRRFSECLCGEVTERLTADELDELRDRMEGADETILSHPHPHLLSLGPVSRMTTRLVARFDRLRDRTVRNRYLPTSGTGRDALDDADPRPHSPARRRGATRGAGR
jgi:hypothetical protein